MEDSYIIGLTGIMGSGKSLLAKIAKEFGVEVIDADKVAFGTLSEDRELQLLMRERWNDKIGDRDLSVRKDIMKIIINDEEEYKWYMELIMPKILFEIRSLIWGLDKPIILVDAPLLFETGFDNETDEDWVVITDPKRAVERVIERNGLHEKTILKIMGKQLSQVDKMKKADKFFWNLYDGIEVKEMLWNQVEKAVKDIKIKLL